MSGWMFLKQYAALRKQVLEEHGIGVVVDLMWCAFEQMRHNTVAMYCVVKDGRGRPAVGLLPNDRSERDESNAALQRKRAAALCHVGRHDFDPAALKVVPEWPLVYWWDQAFLSAVAQLSLLGDVAPVAQGLITSDNARFVRAAWERAPVAAGRGFGTWQAGWVPYIKGAAGLQWIEPVMCVVNWCRSGLEIRTFERAGRIASRPQNLEKYFQQGIAYACIGANFSARKHRVPSIFDSMGASVFPADVAATLCSMNASVTRDYLSAINPTVHFQVGDVNRLPVFAVEGAREIDGAVERSFGIHEAHREPSVEFKQPGPSPWRYAQEWAQLAVDRPEGAPLPDYVETLDPEPPTDHVSFALGVALGRFGANGEGILDPAKADLTHALPAGILFLDGTLDDEAASQDSLAHPASTLLHEAWARHGAAIAPKRSLRAYLAHDFFKDVHKGMYENRPIHWPLSSAGRTFVAWVNIHRMNERTLRTLLADHLHPALARLDAQLGTLRAARDGADKKAANDAEKRLAKLLAAKDELTAFIAAVEACANEGPPPTDPKCPAREHNARYEPDLDDGVMVNSAALWPLLDPQWKDPKKWWKELASAQGKKDYDWSHLAMRYWPTRADQKAWKDPSLGVAHGCFWFYHPERAWAWELRLQDEIGQTFRIEEKPYARGREGEGDAALRAAYLREHPAKALEAVEKEAVRRMGRGAKQKAVPELRILESGLWSALPAEIWAMELRLSEKQGVEFRLLSPDEPEARAAYEAANPAKASERRGLMSTLVPRLVASADDADDDDLADAGAGDEDDAEQEDA